MKRSWFLAGLSLAPLSGFLRLLPTSTPRFASVVDATEDLTTASTLRWFRLPDSPFENAAPAIQEAINFAAQVGGRVVLPRGGAVVLNGLNMPGNVQVHIP